MISRIIKIKSVREACYWRRPELISRLTRPIYDFVIFSHGSSPAEFNNILPSESHVASAMTICWARLA